MTDPWFEFGRTSTWQHRHSGVSVYRLPELAENAWFCSWNGSGVRDILLEAVDIEKAKEEALACFLSKGAAETRTHMSIEDRLTKAAVLLPGMVVRTDNYDEVVVADEPYCSKDFPLGVVPVVGKRTPCSTQPHFVPLHTVSILVDVRNIGHLLEQVRGKFNCPTAWVRMWPAAGIDMSGQDRTRYEVCDGRGRRLVPGERLPAYSAMEALLHALEYTYE